jgi:serine/threonine-protein kinase HipA
VNRELAVHVDLDGQPVFSRYTAISMDKVWAVAPKFGLGTKEARRIARAVATVVRTWRSAGKRYGLKPKELDRMESAFEHSDLVQAAR